MSQQDRFTPGEWRTLQFAPLWMFSAVIGAYGHFDQREYRAFVQTLELATTAPGQLTREVLGLVAAAPGRLTQAYGTDERSIGVGLSQVAAVLEKAPPDEAVMFKAMLVSGIGAGVARARGRFGRQISEEDAKTLTLVAQLLSFDPGEG